MNFFSDYFGRIAACIRSADMEQLSRAFEKMRETRERGGKVILVGNGGSAAMASHVAVDLTKAAGLRAVNFNEADLITCFANDYGYEHWVEQGFGFYDDRADLVVLISSSGRLLNIVNAGRKAKQMGLPLITFSGFDGDNSLRGLGDLNFWADSHAYNVVEMTHHVWLLALVDRLVADSEMHA